MTSKEIYNRYRALYSFLQLNTTWHNSSVKFIEMSINNNQEKVIIGNPFYLPGFVEFSKNEKCLKVLCKDGYYLNISKIKVEGKKVMSAIDFNNGFLKKCPKDQRYFK